MIDSKIRICLPEKKQYLMNDLLSIIDHLSTQYTNKQVEVELYKQAMCSEGKDAQMLLKASIEDMLVLRIENQKLDNKLRELEKGGANLKESGPSHERYFTHHQVSVQTTESQ